MLEGHASVGACESLTVTVKVQGEDVLPAASVAVQLTVVVPFANDEPDAGLQPIVVPGQLSLAAGENVTTAEH